MSIEYYECLGTEQSRGSRIDGERYWLAGFVEWVFGDGLWAHNSAARVAKRSAGWGKYVSSDCVLSTERTIGGTSWGFGRIAWSMDGCPVQKVGRGLRLETRSGQRNQIRCLARILMERKNWRRHTETVNAHHVRTSHSLYRKILYGAFTQEDDDLINGKREIHSRMNMLQNLGRRRQQISQGLSTW
jgi:hypothetical protein